MATVCASYATTEHTKAYVKEQLDLYMNTIKMLLETGSHGSAHQGFRTRDAKDHPPKQWSGEKDAVSFSEFMSSVKNWADVLHDQGVEMLEYVEGSKAPVEEGELDKVKFPDIIKFSKLLFTQLTGDLTGERVKFVNKTARG